MMQATITKNHFGYTGSGEAVDLFTLQNTAGGRIQITNFGGIIVSAQLPDRMQQLAEITLGFDDLTGYLTNPPTFGGIVGRYANRIGFGKFSLAGKTYYLAKNNGPHHLHGGLDGFHKKVWAAEIVDNNGTKSLQLSYTSPNGEEGYPGNLDCIVTYTFAENNELIIDYQAVTDQQTVINLTNHAYFNLKDGGRSYIGEHRLKINARQLTAIDDTCLPTGELLSVAETPFDFSDFKPIGKNIQADHLQITFGNGYDHNFILEKEADELTVAAEVIEPTSGRTLTVLTTEPGVQLYTANWLDLEGKNGIHYQPRSAFCLETQHFPDAPNRPEFPGTILHPEKPFRSTTIYRFGIIN